MKAIKFITHPKAGFAQILKIDEKQVHTVNGFSNAPMLTEFDLTSPFRFQTRPASNRSINKHLNRTK